MSFYQRGGVIGYVVVIGLLLTALVGGITLIKRQGNVAQTNTPAAEQQETAQTNENNTADEKKDEVEQQTRPESTDTDSTPPKANESKPAPNETSTSQNGNDEREISSTSQVAATGPVEDFVSIFGISALSFAVVSYIRSRS